MTSVGCNLAWSLVRTSEVSVLVRGMGSLILVESITASLVLYQSDCKTQNN